MDFKGKFDFIGVIFRIVIFFGKTFQGVKLAIPADVYLWHMPRILAVDYGAKRCGVAETDDMQIIASALETVSAKELSAFLARYIASYPIECLVVGQPVRMGGELSDIEAEIVVFIEKFKKSFPGIPVHRINEMYTSKMAMESMIASGAKKKQRREKGNLDKISATLILQQFLEQKRNQRI